MRRRHLLAAPMLGALWGKSAIAQTLPDSPLKILYGFPAGGAGDFLIRLIADHASKTLQRTIIVVNQVGASGIVSVEALRRAPPDGATIGLVVVSTAVLMPLVSPQAKYDFTTDFEPIVQCAGYSLALAAANDTKVRTLPEFVRFVRDNPDKAMYGATGIGSIPHVYGALIAQKLGVELQNIPFKGGSEVNPAIMGGHVPFAVAVTTDFAEPHKAGRLKMLAVSSERRDVAVPDVPTFSELGHPDLDCISWQGLFAPRGTPEALVKAWNTAVNAALADPAVRDRLVQSGFFVFGGTPERLSQQVALEKARWQPLVASAAPKMN